MSPQYTNVMQLNAGGILYGICHKKKIFKKEKKNSRKQPVIFENTYQSKRNPRDIGGNQSLFMLIFYIYMY